MPHRPLPTGPPLSATTTTSSADPPAPPASRVPAALQRLSPAELVALLALSMSLTALGIDLILPAFPAIRADLGLAADSNATAGLVTAYFVGLAAGQLGFGVLADGRGRRAAMYLGLAVYGLGAVGSVLAPTMSALYATRFVWGVGAAGGRVVTLAVVRDTWSGDRMSRAMSFVMAVFILVPVVTPALGAALLLGVTWRWLFVVCAVAAVAVSLWALRLPETLDPDDRRSMRLRPVVEAARLVARQPATVTGSIGLAMLYGGFTSWIGSSELIIGDLFGLGDRFPLVFGGLASVLGVGMLVNARVVERFGTRRVTRVAMTSYLVVAVALVGLSLATDGVPPFGPFAVGLGLLLGSHALLVPNVNAIAMGPVGRVAGTASALIGTVQIAGGAVLGAVIDQAYDGTILPLAAGFLGYGVVGALVIGVGLRRTDHRTAATPAPAPGG